MKKKSSNLLGLTCQLGEHLKTAFLQGGCELTAGQSYVCKTVVGGGSLYWINHSYYCVSKLAGVNL